MQIHSLKRRHRLKKSRQVGRGGKRGKTSGRGTKGQNARAGHKKRPGLRDIIKTLPKLRGRGKNSFKSFRPPPQTVTLSQIESVFSSGEVVSRATLIAKKFISASFAGKVKILGGTLTKRITVLGCAVTAGARERIEKLGGAVSMK